MVLSAILALVPRASAFDVESYGALLRRYAPAGKVDYGELKKRDWARLDRLYRGLAGEDLRELATPDAELAFWMNAYNLIVLRSATKAYPVKDIWAANKDFFKTPHAVARQRLSLDDIEQKKIREKFKDARIHFGVHCGSKSCPLLASKPYTAENVQEKLDLHARLFVDNEANVVFDDTAGVLRLSKLFQWYAEDFVRDAGSVEKFVAKYLPLEKQKVLASREWKLEYIPYDWGLNAANLR